MNNNIILVLFVVVFVLMFLVSLLVTLNRGIKRGKIKVFTNTQNSSGLRLKGFSANAIKYGNSLINHPMIVEESNIILNRYKFYIDEWLQRAVDNIVKDKLELSVDNIYMSYNGGICDARGSYNRFNEYGIAEIKEKYKIEGIAYVLTMKVCMGLSKIYPNMKSIKISRPAEIKSCKKYIYEIEIRYEIDLGSRLKHI